MYVVKTGKMEMTRYIDCPKCCSTLSYNGYDVIMAFDAPDGSPTMGIRCPVCGEYIPLKLNEMITKMKNMPEKEFLELYKSAFEYDDKYKDFDEYCGCVKDGLNPGFCDEDCEECCQA